jgi:hypothetical protein
MSCVCGVGIGIKKAGDKVEQFWDGEHTLAVDRRHSSRASINRP